MEKIFAKYPPKDRSNLIAILQDIQDEKGFLPQQALLCVAEYLDLPLSTVYGVATFYNQFRLTPLGKYIIRVCRIGACSIAPVININDEYYGRLTSKDIPKIIKKIKADERKAQTEKEVV